MCGLVRRGGVRLKSVNASGVVHEGRGTTCGRCLTFLNLYEMFFVTTVCVISVVLSKSSEGK